MFSPAITSSWEQSTSAHMKAPSRLLKCNFRCCKRPLALLRGSVPMCGLANLAIISQGIDLLGSDSQTWELSVGKLPPITTPSPSPSNTAMRKVPCTESQFLSGNPFNVTISNTFCCGYTLFSLFYKTSRLIWSFPDTPPSPLASSRLQAGVLFVFWPYQIAPKILVPDEGWNP